MCQRMQTVRKRDSVGTMTRSGDKAKLAMLAMSVMSVMFLMLLMTQMILMK